MTSAQANAPGRGVEGTGARLRGPLPLLLGFLLIAGIASDVRSADTAPDAVPWRAMRLQWRRPVGVGSPGDPVRDVALREGRLYYATEGQLGCLQAATGEVFWRRSLLPPAAPRDEPWRWPERRWQIALSGGRIFLSESRDTEPRVPGPCEVRAFDAVTGRRLWQRNAAEWLTGPPAPAGELVLIATFRGGVLAVRAADGATAWEKTWMRASAGGRGTEPGLHVRAEGGRGAALVGGGRLIGFRVADGA